MLENLRDAARLTQWRTLVDDLARTASGDAVRLSGPDATEARSTSTDARTTAGRGLRRDAGRQLASDRSGRRGARPAARAAANAAHQRSRAGARVPRTARVKLAPRRPGRRRTPAAAAADAALRPMGYAPNVPEPRRVVAGVLAPRACEAELHELLGVLDARSSTLTRPSNLAPEIPLHVHAAYSRDEILGAYGEGSPARPPQFREGVRHVESASTDLLLITLRRPNATTRRRRCTATTRSHPTASTGSHSQRRAPAPRRSSATSSTPAVTTRSCCSCASAETLETGAGSPYVCLGPARYLASSGSRPVSFTWELETPMPEELFESARAVAAA